MQKAFSKLAIIAIITLGIMVLYSFILPKFDYQKFFISSSDSLLVLETESDINLDSINTLALQVQKKLPKKKYVKKIKPVSFSEIAGGDDFTSLESFFAKLVKLEKNNTHKVRIAYFGDSITESDLATSRLRKIYQDSLGGNGIGFVPAISELSKYRASIKHTFSNNWTEYSLSKKQDRNKPIGLYGNVALPSIPKTDSLGFINSTISWHKYSMLEGNSLAKPKLLLLNQKAPLKLRFIADTDTLSLVVDIDEKLQIISLSDSLLKTLTISYFPQDTCFVYGIDFSDTKGIYIDNYSLRGNKGNNFTNLKKELLTATFDYFNYDLTILHYGANVTDPIMRDYSWYRISMKNNIRYLQDILSNTDFILFSVGDRGAQKDTLWFSSPDLPYLIKEQKRIAKDTKIGFFNLFTALGGENTNVILEEKGLLTSDHTHFTRKGAKFLGELLFDNFHKEFIKYKVKNNAR